MLAVRFLLRFLLVPLGVCLAMAVAVLVVCLANWNAFAKMIEADPDAAGDVVIAVVVVGPIVAFGMAAAAGATLLPALIGIAVSELLALRSFLFHVCNGALASLLGWFAMQDFLKSYELYGAPTPVVAGGICAGFAYWLVAGWSAGFWKPVFASDTPPPSTPAPA